MARAKRTEAQKTQTQEERKTMSKLDILKKRQVELEEKIIQAQIEEEERGKYRPIKKACTQLQRAKTAMAEAESLLIDANRGEEAKEIFNLRTNHLAGILEGLENLLPAKVKVDQD